MAVREVEMDTFALSYWAVMVLGFLAVAVPGYWLLSGWWQDAREPRWFTPSQREAKSDVEPALW